MGSEKLQPQEPQTQQPDLAPASQDLEASATRVETQEEPQDLWAGLQMTATPIQEEVVPDLPPAVNGTDPSWSLSSEATACLHSLQAEHPIPIDVFVDALIQTWPQLPQGLQQECLQRAYQRRVERLREGQNQRLAAIEQLLALDP
ncbi:MAG: hypothetical protein HC921_14465 [Synechococcaceae cyanobacterium SM2_3_1]|nr:hypothetical protein [Synechococcaceae cyanobacterium SM2_3_1]